MLLLLLPEIRYERQCSRREDINQREDELADSSRESKREWRKERHINTRVGISSTMI